MKAQNYVSKLRIVQKITYDENKYSIIKTFSGGTVDTNSHSNAPYLHKYNWMELMECGLT